MANDKKTKKTDTLEEQKTKIVELPDLDSIPEFQTISREDADAMVVEHMGWAESIARSVARSWNLDWRLDGLDGAAMEALIFCARRFQPDRGIPFKGYARRRIHEASTEVARKSRGWRKTSTTMSASESKAREISVRLFDIFPELRDGELNSYSDGNSGGHSGEDSDTSGFRSSIRELLMGASILATREIASEAPSQEELIDYKRMVTALTKLEPVHQLLMWKVYWEGESLRGVAEEWNTDGLNVIREHQILLIYLNQVLAEGKGKTTEPPRVRPGLREFSLHIKTNNISAPFENLVAGNGISSAY